MNTIYAILPLWRKGNSFEFPCAKSTAPWTTGNPYDYSTTKILSEDIKNNGIMIEIHQSKKDWFPGKFAQLTRKTWQIPTSEHTIELPKEVKK
jgi:archaellum component FlaF (FlaF/FlaG flagellin family)